MNQVLAFGSFVLAGSAIVIGIVGACTDTPALYLAAVILALAFSVTGFHAAEQDHKKGKK